MVAIRGRGWGLAPCLVDLVEECDQLAPNRSTASDGSIGDAAHSARASDHNPADGWVCAVDITDDKSGGCDADLLARHIIARRDPRVKYVIWNRTVVRSYSSRGFQPWEPQPYTGTNPHDSHTHISVHNTTAARNDLSPWWPQNEPAPPPIAPPEDDMAFIMTKDGGSPRLVDGGLFVPLDAKSVASAKKNGWRFIDVTPADYQQTADQTAKLRG